jgi:hypothetical protein
MRAACTFWNKLNGTTGGYYMIGSPSGTRCLTPFTNFFVCGVYSPIVARFLSVSELEQIKTQIQTARCDALPKSVLAKACNYTLTLWTRRSRFLEYPQLELSNNLAENSMRPVAGSEQAGTRVAAILSVVETC